MSDARNTSIQGKAAKARKHRQREDLRWVLGDPRGMRALQRLLLACDVMGRPEAGTHDGSRQLGRREVGLDLLGWVKDVDPRYPAAMEAEYAVEPIVPAGAAEDEDEDE
jgi:hypothetical protein